MSEHISSDKTLDSATDPTSAPLSRNSSFSKLNAQAPEFVPKRSPTPPPPPPNDPRLLIVPPPPTPSAAMVHVYPPTPTPMPVPIQVHAPPMSHMHPHDHNHALHHEQQQHHHHRQNNRHQNHQKQQDKERKEKDGQSHIKQSDKDHGQDNASLSRNNNDNNVNGLSEEAAQKLINQVEYYFSDVNLATTDHLIRFIFKDPEGFVPMSVVSSFKKIKALISGNSQLAAVLRNSTKLVVSEDGKKVKRLHPLTSSDMEELQARIILAENLPEDHCHQNLMKIFSAVGSVKSIRTCQPQPSNSGGSSASRSSKTDNVHYTSKVHAFVEYDSVELAEKAIAELNDEDNWRNGLRVRQLLKLGSKDSKPVPGRTKKAGNEVESNCEEDVSTSEQNKNDKQSEEYSGHPDAQTQELEEEQSMDKEGGPKKNRNRVRGKGRGRGHNNNTNNHHHLYQNNNKSHVGGPLMNSAVNGDHLIGVKQPPPGPRMPDGTRGFSMGRGKPVAVITA